jgi:multiple sugar transport system substrate-binding protein
MKKTIIFVLLVFALALSACGQKPTEAVAPTQAAPAEKVEVIWYVRSEESEQTWEQETIVPDFEAKNPNIKINLTIVPWADFDTKMQTMIAAGTPPDIWSHWGPSGFQDYVKRGLVADLTPYIEKDKFDLSDFVPEVLDIYKVDGKIMGLPILTGGSFIFYNKEQFDKAGIAYPPTNWDDKSWTWDAMLEKCKALTKVTGDPATDVFGCRTDFWPNDQYAWLWGQDLYPDSAYQTGFADQAFLDSPAVIEAFQARQDLVWKYHYAPDPAQTDAMGGGAGPFESGKVAMTMTGVWGWWNYPRVIKDFTFAVAALPYGGENRRDVVFTDPWMLSSKTAHPEEAWTFLKYLASPEVQASWSKLTLAPPVRKSLLSDWYKGFPGMTPAEVEEVFQGSLKYGRESPNHLLVKFDQLNQVVQSAVDPIVNNEKMASETLPAANTALEDALKQIQAEYK